MTKKCFAAIKAAQEVMAAIEAKSEGAVINPETACDVNKEILELAKKWNKDFANVDPGWHPPKQEEMDPHAAAVALGAFIMD